MSSEGAPAPSPAKRTLKSRRTVAGTIASALVAFVGVMLLGAAAFMMVIDERTHEFRPSGQAKLSERDGLRTLNIAGGRIDLIYSADDFSLPPAVLVRWIREAAIATSTYFGRFPVRRVVIRLSAVSGDDVVSGSATAEPDPSIVLSIGRHISERTLFADSTAVHEMTHLGIPDHAERYLWFHEGIATYVETVARAQSGFITAEQAWGELTYGMASGIAEGDDEQGLDHTEFWDRRYWGGTIFFLMADVEIRQRTAGRYGLQDALRSLQSAGGDLAAHWDFERILRTADNGLGIDVLQRLYRSHARRGAPNLINAEVLAKLYRDLGVAPRRSHYAQLDDRAPLATIRRSIMSKPSEPLLIIGPRQVMGGQQSQSRTSSWSVKLRLPEVAR